MTTPAEPVAAPGLYRLLAWVSPSFPIGAFSYSHGLEAAAADGGVRDRASLERWIAAIAVRGSGRIDSDILCEAYRAASAGDAAALDAANRRGLAYRATAELALESGQQGEAFLATCRAAWTDPLIESRGTLPSPPFRAEREGPAPHGSAQGAARGQAPAREGEVGAGRRSGIPHLTPPPLRPQPPSFPPPRAGEG